MNIPEQYNEYRILQELVKVKQRQYAEAIDRAQTLQDDNTICDEEVIAAATQAESIMKELEQLQYDLSLLYN